MPWNDKNCNHPPPKNTPDRSLSSSTRQDLPRGLKMIAMLLFRFSPGCRDERHGAILPVQGHPRLCGCCGAQAVEANMRHHPMMTRRRLIGPQHSRT
uniref:Uncharacterized protein n=1 Tax=Oryza meridionalis TaxID=40149 RepID=A0A0E0CC63_9ORYZ